MHMNMAREHCHLANPRLTIEEALAFVLEECLANPGWGAERLRSHLKAKGFPLGAKSLRELLEKHGLWDKRQRWLELERRWQASKPLSKRQTAFLEACNPSFSQRVKDESKPGERLHQGAFLVGRGIAGVRVYLHAVVDTHSAYAFARLDKSRQADAALRLLTESVLPFFRQNGLCVNAIVTGRMQTFCGTSEGGYAQTLEELRIKQEKRSKGEKSAVLASFVEAAKRECLYAALSPNIARTSLQPAEQALQDWLRAYNLERPQEGFPHDGRTPAAVLEEALAKVTLSEMKCAHDTR